MLIGISGSPMLDLAIRSNISSILFSELSISYKSRSNLITGISPKINAASP
jgi:hypothetical protein